MGITKLAELIKEEAPEAVRAVPLAQFRDNVLALDASVAIYQFRTAMPKIVNREGQNISHLQGLFYRTLHLLENGIKPVYVFDGRPPDLKEPVLAKRAAVSGIKREVTDPSTGEIPQRFLRRDCETLLHLLGVPYVQAPSEAEATCAALVKSGRASCTATEDLDALPFGSLRLLRHLNAKNSDLEEISLPVVLEKLGMTQEQFVDLCILLGCDYCEKIRGLGPKKALKLLQQHGSIEQILQCVSAQKHPAPTNWPLEEARRLFLQPEVAEPSQLVLEWREPDEAGLVQFLAREKHMNEGRVCRRMERWRETCLKLAQPQLPGPVTEDGSRQKMLREFFPVKKRTCKAPGAQPCKKRRRSKVKIPEAVRNSAEGT
ncbi:probable flap endonuclease 1 homolog [Eublepharis macularius]|uniref:Flap endonuclease 1 n=1 Tax=Eublepharis macularius TaxID=481883 RepID=A0AA97L4S9_EUBMA|nr:probable flap endonuclease 1 homolog [Eublepharis macularius]